MVKEDKKNSGATDVFVKKGLTIEVSRVIEGLLGGSLASLHSGASVEFSEHNKYYPGDDIRTLDWKAFARTDRYFTKSHEREVQLSCLMLIDCSFSMNYTGSSAIYSKFEFAKILAGSMGQILISQGDGAGILSFAHKPLTYISPQMSPKYRMAFFRQLEKIAVPDKNTTDFTKALNMAAERIGQRGMIVLLSDLLGASGEVETALARLSAKGHDVIVFYILSPDELYFPFMDFAEFADMESEQRLWVEPSLLRDDYRRALKREKTRWHSLAGRAGIDIIDVNTGEDPLLSLISLVNRRHGKRRYR
jgi:uncharacterized protein (DUF58 family)